MATTATQNYAEYSLTELYEALSSIQHETYPEAFAALVTEIDTRTFSSMTELEDCYFKLDKKKWPEYGRQLWEQIESGGGFTVLADEVITKDNRYRNVWRRIFATLIDRIVLIVLGIVMAVVVVFKLSAIPWLLPFVEVATQYLWVAYFILLHGFYGQTIGKMMTGVKVVDVSEKKPITFWQATLREVVPLSLSFFIMVYILVIGAIDLTTELAPHVIMVIWWVLGLAIVWFLAEIITMLISKKRRAIHDFIAGTVVVRSTWSELQETLGSTPTEHRDD